jgi:hypothetical protein
METLATFAKTQVEGGKQKMASKGKGKLKEKMTEPLSSNTFIKSSFQTKLYRQQTM